MSLVGNPWVRNQAPSWIYANKALLPVWQLDHIPDLIFPSVRTALTQKTFISIDEKYVMGMGKISVVIVVKNRRGKYSNFTSVENNFWCLAAWRYVHNVYCTDSFEPIYYSFWKKLSIFYFQKIEIFTFICDPKNPFQSQTKPNFAPVDNLRQASYKHKH